MKKRKSSPLAWIVLIVIAVFFLWFVLRPAPSDEVAPLQVPDVQYEQESRQPSPTRTQRVAQSEQSFQQAVTTALESTLETEDKERIYNGEYEIIDGVIEISSADFINMSGEASFHAVTVKAFELNMEGKVLQGYNAQNLTYDSSEPEFFISYVSWYRELE